MSKYKSVGDEEELKDYRGWYILPGGERGYSFGAGLAFDNNNTRTKYYYYDIIDTKLSNIEPMTRKDFKEQLKTRKTKVWSALNG